LQKKALQKLVAFGSAATAVATRRLGKRLLA
jgi:hypothetical protein